MFTDLVGIEAGLVQPGVGLKLVDGVAVTSVVAEELEDHVLEVCGETSSIDLLKVGVNLASEQQVVKVLFLASLLEREDALNDNEDDNTD